MYRCILFNLSFVSVTGKVADCEELESFAAGEMIENALSACLTGFIAALQAAN